MLKIQPVFTGSLDTCFYLSLGLAPNTIARTEIFKFTSNPPLHYFILINKKNLVYMIGLFIFTRQWNSSYTKKEVNFFTSKGNRLKTMFARPKNPNFFFVIWKSNPKLRILCSFRYLISITWTEDRK